MAVRIGTESDSIKNRPSISNPRLSPTTTRTITFL